MKCWYSSTLENVMVDQCCVSIPSGSNEEGGERNVNRDKPYASLIAISWFAGKRATAQYTIPNTDNQNSPGFLKRQFALGLYWIRPILSQREKKKNPLDFFFLSKREKKKNRRRSSLSFHCIRFFSFFLFFSSSKKKTLSAASTSNPFFFLIPLLHSSLFLSKIVEEKILKKTRKI